MLRRKEDWAGFMFKPRMLELTDSDFLRVLLLLRELEEWRPDDAAQPDTAVEG